MPAVLLASTALALLLQSSQPPPPNRCQIDFEEHFDVPPQTLFPYFSEGDKIRWLGPFRIIEQGRTDPFEQGSVRQVKFIRVIVEERVMHYDPPHELRYAVTRHKTIRNHRASMRVFETARGSSRMFWSIRFDSTKRNPSRHCRSTRRYLTRRIKKLRRALKKAQT